MVPNPSIPRRGADTGRVAGAKSASVVSVTSRVAARWHSAVERMVFFNEYQQSVRPRVAAAVERYGTLQLTDEKGNLRLRLERLPDAQVLFAVLPDGQPIGCVVYSRDVPERFLVLHVAVEPAYTTRGQLAAGEVLLDLVAAVRAAARRTRGGERVDLLYTAGRMR